MQGPAWTRVGVSHLGSNEKSMGSKALSIDPRILGQVLSMWAMKEVGCVMADPRWFKWRDFEEVIWSQLTDVWARWRGEKWTLGMEVNLYNFYLNGPRDKEKIVTRASWELKPWRMGHLEGTSVMEAWTFCHRITLKQGRVGGNTQALSPATLWSPVSTSHGWTQLKASPQRSSGRCSPEGPASENVSGGEERGPEDQRMIHV